MAKHQSFGKSKLGSGGRFKACMASGKSAALCASIGRNAYGAKKMAKLSAHGRKSS